MKLIGLSLLSKQNAALRTETGYEVTEALPSVVIVKVVLYTGWGILFLLLLLLVCGSTRNVPDIRGGRGSLSWRRLEFTEALIQEMSLCLKVIRCLSADLNWDAFKQVFKSFVKLGTD